MFFESGCVICSSPAGPVCAPCRASLVPAGDVVIDGLASCRVGFDLDDRARSLIAAFKYRRHRRLARWLALELEPLVPRTADVITWVPATPERRRMRGFDQAHELARCLSRRSGVPLAGLMVRDPADRRQTDRDRAARLRGPALRAVRRSPQFAVVVDDVVTTGSTLRTAGAVLSAAGADRIVAVAAAAKGWSRSPHDVPVGIATSIRAWT